MAYRLAGTGCPVTIAGQTVRFNPWDVDWEWYSDCLVDGTWFVYNITRAQSSAITAKTGTEASGYTFTVGAIPAWVSGDTAVILPSNVLTVHATVAALLAASAAYDTVILAYFTNTYSPWFGGSIAMGVKPLHLYGHLSRQRVTIGVYAGTAVIINGDQSANVARVVWRNFTVTGSVYGCYYNDTGAGKTGGGFLVRRVVSVGIYGAFWVQGAKADACRFEFCINNGSNSSTIGFSTAGPVIRCYHCGNFFGSYGFNNSNTASTYQNCQSYFAATGNFWGKAGGAYTKCAAGGDATGSEAALNNLTWPDGAFWGYGGNNGFFGLDGVAARILTTSVLAGAGTPVAGLDKDIDGNDISVDCPIGPHKGTGRSYDYDPNPIRGYELCQNVVVSR